MKRPLNAIKTTLVKDLLVEAHYLISPLHLNGEEGELIEAQTRYNEKEGACESREAGLSWAVDPDSTFQTGWCGDMRQSYEDCMLRAKERWCEIRQNDEASCSTRGQSGEVLLYSVVSGCCRWRMCQDILGDMSSDMLRSRSEQLLQSLAAVGHMEGVEGVKDKSRRSSPSMQAIEVVEGLGEMTY